jgi:hypothetical protein
LPFQRINGADTGAKMRNRKGENPQRTLFLHRQGPRRLAYVLRQGVYPGRSNSELLNLGHCRIDKKRKTGFYN